MRRLKHQLRLFFLALQFFTRLPIPRRVRYEAGAQRQAIRYFPLTGIAVAVIGAAVYTLARCVWPQAIAVLLAMAGGIFVTGALHEDGLADTCDGLGAGGNPERILAIMRDSHVGVFGMAGLALALGLKYAALSALPTSQVAAALLLAHPLSRLACLPLIRWMRYVRPQGKARTQSQWISGAECRIAFVTALPLPLLIAGTGWLAWQGVLCGVLLAAVGVCLLARRCGRQLGGYTGDCLGAVQQVAEVLLYLGLTVSV